MLYISNPPYTLADKFIENMKGDSVILAPFKKFKKHELYKHVQKAVIVDRHSFTDIGQNIEPNLLIVKLQETSQDIELTEIESKVWNPQFVEYYLLNLKIKPNFSQYVYNNDQRKFVTDNLSKIFFIPYWPHVGNVQGDRSVTKLANEGNEGSLERILKSNRSYCYFIFESELEKENAFTFWKTNLNNELIFGNLTRSLIDKFPHIDWKQPTSDNYTELLQRVESSIQ